MQPETHSTTSARRLALCCAAASGGIALACAAIGVFGQPGHVASVTDHIARVPPSAWVMLLLSVALFLRAAWPASQPVRLMVCAVAAIIGLTSLAVLLAHLQGAGLSVERWRTGIDIFIYSVMVGRMAPLTTVISFLAAVALLSLLEPPTQWRSWMLQRLATGSALAVLLVVCGMFMGYASGLQALSTGPMLTTVLTALCFAVLAVGIISLTMHGERWMRHIAGESWAGVDAQSRRFRFRLLAAFVMLVVAIGAIGSAHLRRQIARARDAAESEMAATGRLKAEQIVNWRADRLRDARLFAHAVFVREQVQAFFDNPASASAKAELVRWLSLLNIVNRNARVLLFDRDLNLRLALPDDAREVGPVARQYAAEALKAAEPVLTDLHRGDAPGSVHMDIAFAVLPPVARDGAEAKPIAAILLQLDPRVFLYPYVQSWPTASPTAETLLVRREGEKVLYLNDLRHRANTALNLALPLDDPDLPSAVFLRGDAKEQLVEGLDYRGVPVLAALRRVPDSPWMLESKVDQEENFAPLRQQAWATIATLILLMAVVALVVVLLWRQRLSDSLRRELSLERERKLLAERLALLMRHANDIVVLSDAEWRIVEVNDRALETYGYAPAEMRQKRISDLRAPEASAGFSKQMAVVQDKGSSIFETLHRR
ncbi:MAG: PAS domain S-box protein, partial [Verrucomicrobia bacterium]|nr:PAS domain S-box protein [Verrucomicrobiota bacterium]